jgi:hypothetical protein
MKGHKVFVNGEHIGSTTPLNIDEGNLIDVDNLGNPNEYEYYMKKGSRIYFRNAFNKLSIDFKEFGISVDYLKYGAKLIIHEQPTHNIKSSCGCSYDFLESTFGGGTRCSKCGKYNKPI